MHSRNPFGSEAIAAAPVEAKHGPGPWWNTIDFDGTLGDAFENTPNCHNDLLDPTSPLGGILPSVDYSEPAPSYHTSLFETVNHTLPFNGQEVLFGDGANLTAAYPYDNVSPSGNPSQLIPSYPASPFEVPNGIYPTFDQNRAHLNSRVPTTVAARPTSSRRRPPTTSQPRVTCPEPGCHKSYARPSDLRRHALTHQASAPRFDCPVQGCHRRGANGFLRADKRREHYRNIHEV